MPVFQLNEQPLFPHPDLAEENGLLAVGGDLRPERLLAAYRQGIFPWYGEDDPILWWFTSPRLVLIPENLHVPKRLARTMRKQPFQLSYDTAFEKVIEHCGNARGKDREDTWIDEKIITAYTTLHHLGYGHSVECWQEGKLVGGLYGVRLDGIFFGESMFSTVSDASKIALVTLVEILRKKKVQLIDCQMTTSHLLRFGAQEISSQSFQHYTKHLIRNIQPDGKWTD